MDFEETQKSLPPNLAQIVAGCEWKQIHLGLSPSKVFRLASADKNSLYLKISRRQTGFSLLQEKLRLQWLENRLPIPIPKVLEFAENEITDYLLLSEIPGVPASDDFLKGDVRSIIQQLVEGLKIIHNLPIEDCPFNERLDTKVEIARQRILEGLVDEDDFDEERLNKTAEDVFRELIEIAPSSEDLVFTHGDYCVPNVILKNGKLSGFVDFGKAGVADRSQDLALLERRVGYNFGEEWRECVFEFYGIEPDREKIRFYQMLDEFF